MADTVKVDTMSVATCMIMTVTGVNTVTRLTNVTSVTCVQTLTGPVSPQLNMTKTQIRVMTFLELRYYSPATIC